jgi:hypothetical protein
MATAQSKVTTAVQAEMNGDGLLKGRRTTMLLDEAAANLRKTWRNVKDSVEQIHQMQERDNIEIESYTLEGLRDFSPNMKETMTFSKQCDTAGDMIYLNPLIFIPMRESPFKDAERMLPVEFPFRQSEMLNVVLTLPEGYAVEEVPKPIIMKFDGATARLICNVTGQQLNMQFRLNIDKPFYIQTEYHDLKDFFDKLSERSKDIVTIRKMGN